MIDDGHAPRRGRQGRQKDGPPSCVSDPTSRDIKAYLRGELCAPADFGVATYHYRTDRGWRVGILVDDCTDWISPVDSIYGFAKACRVHDYGYELIRYWYRRGMTDTGKITALRRQVDAEFGLIMYANCSSRYGHISQLKTRVACSIAAGVYYGAVSAFGGNALRIPVCKGIPSPCM